MITAVDLLVIFSTLMLHFLFFLHSISLFFFPALFLNLLTFTDLSLWFYVIFIDLISLCYSIFLPSLIDWILVRLMSPFCPICLIHFSVPSEIGLSLLRNLIPSSIESKILLIAKRKKCCQWNRDMPLIKIQISISEMLKYRINMYLTKA